MTTPRRVPSTAMTSPRLAKGSPRGASNTSSPRRRSRTRRGSKLVPRGSRGAGSRRASRVGGSILAGGRTPSRKQSIVQGAGVPVGVTSPSKGTSRTASRAVSRASSRAASSRALKAALLRPAPESGPDATAPLYLCLDHVLRTISDRFGVAMHTPRGRSDSLYPSMVVSLHHLSEESATPEHSAGRNNSKVSVTHDDGPEFSS